MPILEIKSLPAELEPKLPISFYFFFTLDFTSDFSCFSPARPLLQFQRGGILLTHVRQELG